MLAEIQVVLRFAGFVAEFASYIARTYDVHFGNYIGRTDMLGLILQAIERALHLRHD